jgi:FkbM family methyltransferase
MTLRSSKYDAVIETPEYRARLERMPQFELAQPRIESGYVIDCLGGRTNRKYISMSDEDWARHSFGGMLDAFAPSFSEDYYDWLDLLDAVAGSSRPFTMVELGAGYGRWLVHGANLCKKLGRSLGLLVGCEAEPTHFDWMKQHLRDNGYSPDLHRLCDVAVAEVAGAVPFYVGAAASWYGQSIATHPMQPRRLRRPNLARMLRRFLGKEKPMDVVKMVRAMSLKEIVGDLESIDFMHVDIQGAEYDVLVSSKDLLDAKVKSIHVGTHSTGVEATRGRDMDALINELFSAMGWSQRIRVRPGEKISLHGQDITFVDGVNSWANTRRFEA